MAGESENSKLLMLSIFLVQKLRENVNKTFSCLHEGVMCGKDDDVSFDGKVKHFITHLQHNLCSVNDNISELEKLSNSIVKVHVSQGSSLGVTGLLSLDPVLDKTPLYQQVLQSYKWSSKLKEHASHAYALLNHHCTMRRSSSIGSKKRKIQQNLTMEQMVSTLNRQYMDIMMINKVPNMPNVYQVTLGRTFYAIVGLRRLLIERVVVRGQHENIYLDDRMVDIWTLSRYKVFQKITDHATSAMLHYHLPLKAEMCFYSFMKWLHSYQKLFSTPCRHCGQFLQDNLPPTWHDFRSLLPFHEGCRQ
ncbi:mediator of RNA polymerase II transcription subunit 27-like [Acanthaster planci]|uniref:Mediator of RNA polymerase II transcription subunit 27-like n=1 Tax=Acanthaster planci TaxID=133434 RepID=A0A8B7YNT2_ACAPL|nr:mediator of RNA polymerase II transcription subunit 27-like [Acanthaster planci]